MLFRVKENDYSGCRAVVGVPSVGNVGQLAADLVVRSTSAVESGWGWDESILPFAGADSVDSSSREMSTPCQLYFSEERKLLIVQLRSPVANSGASPFFDYLCSRLRELGVIEVFAMAGMFSVGHHDEGVSYGSLRCVSSSSDSLPWTRLKGNTPNNSCPRLPGAASAHRLFDACLSHHLPCTILLYFCLDGDNLPDAISLFEAANSYLGFLPDSDNHVKYPSSWSHLFGNSIPDMMY